MDLPIKFVLYYGKWSAQGGNSYELQVTRYGSSQIGQDQVGDKFTVIYDPAQNAIYEPRYPTILYTSYQGNVMTISRFTSSPTPTPTPTPTPSPIQVSKNILFSDSLSSWRSEWFEEFEISNVKVFYSGGSLHIRNTNPPTGSSWDLLKYRDFNDFMLDVDTKLVDGTPLNWQGVIVRLQDERNYYSLSISASGSYLIEKVEEGNIIVLAGPTSTSYINKGIGANNHIHCEVNGNTLSLWVNGHHLNTVTDSTFKQGTVGLTVDCSKADSFSEVAFNNFVLTSIT
jgi:hypothetical protein